MLDEGINVGGVKRERSVRKREGRRVCVVEECAITVHEKISYEQAKLVGAGAGNRRREGEGGLILT